MTESTTAAEKLSWRHNTLTVIEVAAIMSVTPNYLWRCIRAAGDQTLLAKYRLTPRSIRDMPVKGWFKCAKKWRIRELDLTRQLNERYRLGTFQL